MTTAETAPQDAPAIPSVSLPCPLCGSTDASISLVLTDGDFHCHQCEANFTQDDVRSLIAGAKRWERVLKWCHEMPTE